jgi:hypothetical protein
VSKPEKSWSEKIYGGVGWAAGGVLNLAIKGGGVVAEAVAKDPIQGKERREAWSRAGDGVHEVTTGAGQALGRTVAAVSAVAGKAGGHMAAHVAEVTGADARQTEVARVIGTVVASAGVGFATGEVLTGGLIGAIGALDGLHGAAAAAHGAKVIGSIIHGGETAGRVIVSGVDTASAISTLHDGSFAENETNQPQKKLLHP